MLTRRRLRRQSGQVLVVTALIAVLLVGATALAVDLSVNTQNRRNLQNMTDAAALAGARSLPNNQIQALKDALDVLERNSPWAGNATWLATAQAAVSCTSGNCTVSVAGPTSYSSYTVAVSSPPSSAINSSYNTKNYIEVDLAQNSRNGLAGVIGASSSTERGHSVGYNTGPPAPYQYTFFAKIQAGSGNQQEHIIGDAYVGGGYSPQSSGKAGMCLFELPPPEPASDTDGDIGGAQDSDLDDQGHLVFGAVPPTVGPEPAYSQSGSSCPGGGQLNVQQPSPQSSAPTNCPSGSTAQKDNGTGTWLCYQANPLVPDIPAPIPTKPALCGVNGSATVDNSTSAGVYSAGAGCTVTLDLSKGNIDCVSLVLGSGASVNVNDKKGQNYISSYGFDPTGDTVAAGAILAIGATVPTTPCAGHNVSADRSVIWAPDTTASPMPIALSNGTTGCCSDTLFLGTVYLPDQQVSFSTNQAMEDVGSVYCGQWNVQSGNHPNPMVSYDASAAGIVRPGLRLVE